MSKVVGYSCPHCGAPLPASVQGAAFCPFCGSTVSVTSGGQAVEPRKFGYEFEYGRYDAQNSIPGARLASEISKLLKPIDVLNQSKARLAELEQRVKLTEENLREYTKNNGKLKYLVPVASLLFLNWVNVAILASVGIACAEYLFFKARFARQSGAMQSAITSDRAKIQETEARLNELHSKYNFSLVPADYLQYEPMSFFVKVLNSGRAASLQQAINIYEDEKHKKKLLRLQEEQNRLKEEELEMQRKQLELAQQKTGVDWGAIAAAAGTVAIAVLTLKGKRK